MGLQYEIPDYLAALVIRRFRTLMVEGPSDKVLVCSTLHKINEEQVQVDVADIVRPPQPGMGMREVVEAVATAALSNSINKITALVDREWRLFTLPPDAIEDNVQGHHRLTANLFWTEGHSSENYVLLSNLYSSFMLTRFPDRLPVGIGNKVKMVFDASAVPICALSLSLSREGLLSRSNNLLSPACWRLELNDQDQLYTCELDDYELEKCLESRAVSHDAAARVVITTKQIAKDISSNNTDHSLVTRVMHGHVGYESLWSVVAAFVQLKTGDTSLAQEICRGFREEKWKHMVQLWTIDNEKSAKFAEMLQKMLREQDGV